MTESKELICRNCPCWEYWYEKEDGIHIGLCKGEMPKVFVTPGTDLISSHFPPMVETGWCWPGKQLMQLTINSERATMDRATVPAPKVYSTL